LKPIATASVRQYGAVLAIGTAGALLLSAVPALAGTHPPGQQRVAVPQGIGAAALSRSHVVGQPRATARERVSFILSARHLSQLQARVSAGGTHYLTVSQFAKTFGQPTANITALGKYLHRFGITTKPLADRLVVSTTGTVAAYNKALGIHQSTFQSPAIPAKGGRPARPSVRFHGTTDPTTLPARFGKFVLSILGLTSYPAGTSNAVHVPKLPGLRPAAIQKANLKPSDFARRYHLNTLQTAGHLGQGQTIGIVTLASMRATDATHFWSKTLKITTKPHRLTLANVDGGAGKVSEKVGSGETTLDVEQSGALAPQANVVVYQAPNSDAGFIDAFATAASQNKAGAVSCSWGDSETFINFSAAARIESRTFARAFNQIFLELAAQGQSSFTAAGDAGAYDAAADQGSTNLSVDEPGSSPWITDAGGTTLPGTIPVTAGVRPVIKAERAWGWDWLWPFWKKLGAKSEKAFVEQNIAGGGGGFSAVSATPSYQAGFPNVHRFSAVKYLTPTKFVTKHGVRLPTDFKLTPSPKVSTGTGRGRAVPDVSTDADPFTGYEEFFSGFSGSKLETGWGGTSFVAPQLAGATAVINSAVGRRVGFWNPAIYRMAASASSPFTPLSQAGRSNDNLFYTGTSGTLFNPGTGLGVPDFAALATAFG
jgi:kumamolisin